MPCVASRRWNKGLDWHRKFQMERLRILKSDCRAPLCVSLIGNSPSSLAPTVVMESGEKVDSQ